MGKLGFLVLGEELLDSPFSFRTSHFALGARPKNRAT
jgi:hypothetical protein